MQTEERRARLENDAATKRLRLAMVDVRRQPPNMKTQPSNMGNIIKGTVSRYIDKNRTRACGLGRNRSLLRHTELVFLSTVCARRVVLVLFTNMDAVN